MSQKGVPFFGHTISATDKAADPLEPRDLSGGSQPCLAARGELVGKGGSLVCPSKGNSSTSKATDHLNPEGPVTAEPRVPGCPRLSALVPLAFLSMA